MQDREGDDFSAFAGSEHMFFHLSEPYKLIREELEKGLRRQVPDTVVKPIQTFGQPKFLTSGRKADDGNLIVTAFGFSVLALLLVSNTAGAQSEEIAAGLTFLFGNVDQKGSERCRTYFDLHGDADRNFNDEVFKQRFLAYRHELTETAKKPWWKFWG